jgi:hypothetical protein
MLLRAVALAGTAGARVTGTVGSDIVRMVMPDGREFGLVLVEQAVEEHHAGRPEDVEALINGLSAAFIDHRYVLYIKHPVPAGLDTSNITRAVRLWQSAIAEGEWQGRHAVYEDDSVSIELTLAGPREDGQDPLVLMVGPVQALERLTALDARLVELVEQHARQAPGLPLVYAVGCTGASKPSRGYLEQLLYGTADWVHASSSEWSYTAGFTHTGRSLFGDAACVAVTSLWWLEPEPSGLGFRSTALDNPWSEDQLVVPIAGRRFQVVPGEDGQDGAVLSWTACNPTAWIPKE